MSESTDDARMPQTVRIDVERARSAIRSALQAHGAIDSDAAIQADTLLEGDLRGHPSHGIRRLPVLVGRLDAGLIVSGPPSRSEWVAEAALVVDAQRGFGPVAAWDAVDAIAERAGRTGIALATVRNSSHIGMLAPYVERLARAGHVGLVLTTSEALVHPWGGVNALVGTNPVGIGVPTPTDPLVLDMSTGAVSMGKIIEHAAMGRALGPGWAVDATGAPTTDAAAALHGAISPFGGAKGYALGIAFEALVGILTSGVFGTDVLGTLDTRHPVTKGDVFIAISVERLGAAGNLAALAGYLEIVRGSGSEGNTVAVPGDRARNVREERLSAGIPIAAQLWDEVLRFSGEDAL